jgi:hypothetical protein
VLLGFGAQQPEPGFGEGREGVEERGVRPTFNVGGGHLVFPGDDPRQRLGNVDGVLGFGQVDDVAVEPLGEEDFVLVFLALTFFLEASTKGVRMVCA